MSERISGFALRKNGTCEDSEVDCGRTVSPFRACCPGSTFCPNAWNVDCCPSTRNCTSSLLEEPKCADGSWDLYDNDGYFCCEKGTQGYASTTDSSGCAAPGYAFKEGERLLRLVSLGRESTSSSVAPTTSSTSLASTSSSTSSQQPSSTESSPASDPTSESDSNQATGPDSGKSSSTNVGAIAGGVVGGVLGLLLIAVVAWLLLKRRRKAQNQELDGVATRKHELDGSTVRNHELDGSGKQQVISELPGHNTVHEAPG